MMKLTAKRGEQGFTVIELMVAVVLVAVVTSQLFLVFRTQKKAYIANERILDVQEDARLIVDLLASETRMAGFMVPRLTGMSSVDGGSSAADILCLSDPSVMNKTQVAAQTERFDAGSVASIDSGGDIVTLASASDLDVDGDDGSLPDFYEQRGIVISDGTNSHCARITDVDEATLKIEFTPVISNPTSYVTASVRVAPAIVYEVGTSMGLSRNNMLLSSEVEDLQVEYGVDVNLDDLVDESDPSEFPLDSIDGSNPEEIRIVRLTVVARTMQNDPEYNGPGYPGAANRAAGASDGFRRRLFVTRVLPRNLR